VDHGNTGDKIKSQTGPGVTVGVLFVGLVKFVENFFCIRLVHTNPLTDTFLIISVVYHAFYGIRTVIMDMGFRNEKLLFRMFTLLGGVVSALLLLLYFTRDY